MMKKAGVYTFSILILTVIVCLLSQPAQASVSMIDEETFDGGSSFNFCIDMIFVDDVWIFKPMEDLLPDQLDPDEPFCSCDCHPVDGDDLYPLLFYSITMDHLGPYMMDDPDLPFEAAPVMPWYGFSHDDYDDCGFEMLDAIFYYLLPDLVGYHCWIPEPATLALLGLGCLPLRKRK